MLWCQVVPFLPTCIHLFGRLQGEVSTPPLLKYRKLIYVRIIIVGLCNLGHCPCLQCLIPMDRVPNMGMPRDMSQHVSLVRVDDVKWRIRVKAAHEAIYEHNHRVGSVAVEKLLKEHSLVPAAVGGVFLIMRLVLMFYSFRMHFLTSYHYLTSICLRC